MAIAPFRASRFGTKVAPLSDSAPAVYAYIHRQGDTALQGLVALLDSESWQFLRLPMGSDPVATAFARHHLSSKREQLAPVLALYDSPESPILKAHRNEPAVNGECRIEPILEPGVLKDLQVTLSGSQLTVVGGQEWLDAADGRPCIVLFVNLRTCTPELEALHRTVRCDAGWQAGEMVRLGREHFFFHDISRFMPQLGGTGPHYSKPTVLEYLRPKSAGENVYIVVTARHTFRVHSLPGWADTVLAHRSPEERTVSAVQLHEVLMADGLQMAGEGSTGQRLGYTNDMDQAIACVTNGEADVAFLMNAPSIEQIVAVARTGGSIPPHTFRPRLMPVPGAITYAF